MRSVDEGWLVAQAIGARRSCLPCRLEPRSPSRAPVRGATRRPPVRRRCRRRGEPTCAHQRRAPDQLRALREAAKARHRRATCSSWSASTSPALAAVVPLYLRRAVGDALVRREPIRPRGDRARRARPRTSPACARTWPCRRRSTRPSRVLHGDDRVRGARSSSPPTSSHPRTVLAPRSVPAPVPRRRGRAARRRRR